MSRDLSGTTFFGWDPGPTDVAGQLERLGRRGPPGTPRLISFSCCARCQDGLPAGMRCSGPETLALATVDELMTGEGAGAGCPLDREDELARRERLGPSEWMVVESRQRPREGFWAWLTGNSREGQ